MVRGIVSLFLVAFVARVPIAWASTSQERVADNYLGTYRGPDLFTQPPFVPLSQQKNDHAIEDVLQQWFNKEIFQKTAAFEAKLREARPEVYNAFLAEQKKTAASCVDALSREHKAELARFSFAYDYQERDAVLRAVAKASAGGDPCVGAVFSLIDKHGILIGTAARGKPTIYNPGVIHVLWPEVLYAWPGRTDAPTRILDPREGPFRVALAHTFEPKVETHSQAWKQKPTVDVETYLNRTNNGHLLVVDELGDALGWIDMDRAAFWDRAMQREGYMAQGVYRDGSAATTHGVFWDDYGARDKVKGRRCETSPAPLWVNDFLSLVVLNVPPKICAPLDKPPARAMQVYQLRTVVRYVVDEQELIKRYEQQYELRLEWRKGGARAWEVREPHGFVRSNDVGIWYMLEGIIAYDKHNLADIYRSRGVELSIESPREVAP